MRLPREEAKLASLTSKSSINVFNRFQRTACGQRFDASSDDWTFDSGPIRFGRIRVCIDPEMFEDLKRMTSIRLQTEHVTTIINQFGQLERLLRRHFASTKTLISLIDARVLKTRFQSNEKYGRQLAPILKEWFAFSGKFVCRTAIDFLSVFDWRPCATYTDVSTLDPLRGPFVGTEIQMIDEALRHAYQTNRIDCERYLLASIFRVYGQRPIQVANLKCGQVKTPKHNGADHAKISFTNAKFRSTEERIDGCPRPIPLGTLNVLDRHLDNRYQNSSSDEHADLPLFSRLSKSFRHAGKCPAPRREPGFVEHLTSQNISARYKSVMDGLGLISPRTGQPMVFSPVRDRHTVATQLALAGLGKEHIAAWLQHSSPDACQAYIDLGIQYHQTMHAALDGNFTHFGARFFGEVIETQMMDPLVDLVLIQSVDLKGVPDIGSCSSIGCAAIDNNRAPFACFSCSRFKVFKDAPLYELRAFVSAEYTKSQAMNARECMKSQARIISSIKAAEDAIAAAKNSDIHL